ncbi:Uncharacterized protein CGCS363_v006607 [Colletotrichum siamense]|uniref:Uncharacterized protein n=1 Tax=Colletotrichum siamense TaxID=690259 RepID=UPI00187293D5|nr:Uncharacterized protein CGCS363_v006607 [Colletotrichum siamense]KAF5500256.1 Uncharacterized protein CGCS363_v006607 [Colletotrichum siamense]
MASVLGKRKAPSANVSKKPAPATATKKSSSSASKAAAATTKKRKTSGAVKPQTSRKPEAEAQEDEATMDAQEIFRRHFEAAFAPLPGTAGAKRKAKKGRAAAMAEESEDDDDDDDEEEEDLDEDVGVDDEDGWGGVSDEDEEDDDEGENVVEVVDHSSSKPLPAPSMSKRELKAFMSSKPPSQTDPNPTTPASETPADEDDENDKSMLANDLALQRLLSESHLLAKHSTSSSTSSEPKSFAAGKLRQRQLDMRMQSLAPGVASLFKQDKMPMAQRKGIVAKAAQRETTRRRQAKENGVVLEREAPAPKKKSGGGRGERSVGGPSVGRT